MVWGEQKVVGGLVGLITALLLEATLLILRTGFESDKAAPAFKQTQQQQQPATSGQLDDPGQRISATQQQLRPVLPSEAASLQSAQPAMAGTEGPPAVTNLVQRKRGNFVEDARGNIVDDSRTVASLEHDKAK